MQTKTFLKINKTFSEFLNETQIRMNSLKAIHNGILIKGKIFKKKPNDTQHTFVEQIVEAALFL